MNIVHLVAEYWPFARTGGLADEHDAGIFRTLARHRPGPVLADLTQTALRYLIVEFRERRHLPRIHWLCHWPMIAR